MINTSKIIKIFLVPAVTLWFGIYTSAQVPIPHIGILNGKAVQLVKPDYPAKAKNKNASGAVKVELLVEQNGSVRSAEMVSGDEVFREAAENAAKKSTFAPYKVNGNAVMFVGTLVYNFAADSSPKSGLTSAGTFNNQTSAATPPTTKSGRFTSGDTEIYYEVYGAEKKSTPLVVLHGGPGFDHQYFLSNSAFTDLAKNRPVVFYDQRGTGKSAKISEDQIATLDNNLEDLVRLTKFLGYEKIDLAGHSWGGFLAMAYAVIFPKQIAHLIIIDSMSENFDDYGKYENFDNAFPKESKEMSRLRMEALFMSDAKKMRASIVEYMKMLFHSPQNRDRFIAGSDKFTYDSHVNSSVVSSAEGVDLTNDLKKSRIPTLIIHGRFDANIIIDSAEEIRDTIPGSQLVIFENSGHLPFYEEKEKFVKTVESFLSK